jgi:toxin FitB
MNCLVDTNVVSEWARKTPHPQVLHWFERFRGELSVSVVTLEEIEFGFAWKPQPTKAAMLADALVGVHHTWPVTAAIAKRAGVLRGQLAALGRVRSMPDMLIAATALEHRLTVLTRNERDFVGCGVAVVNPFSKPKER